MPRMEVKVNATVKPRPQAATRNDGVDTGS